ncbi:MAG: ABC transporter substrate-binding protein [Burkholderiales bacterium]
MTDRRTFVGLVASACLLEPFAVRAQQTAKIVRIGLLMPETAPNAARVRELEELRAGLRDLGWIEGKTIVVEMRWAGTDPRRQRELAAELAAIPVALILATGTTAIASARDGASRLPVVMINAGDPVGSKFVASLARPGGYLTGTSALGEEVLAKQVELLAAAVPRLKRITVLMNDANPANGFFFDAISMRAKTLGIAADRIEIATEGDLGRAIASANGGALQVVNDPMFTRRDAEIASMTLRARVPSIYGRREYVDAGGLMSFTSSSAWHWRSAAVFVDKILRGAKPAELPVEQATTFDLVINLKTASALGLTIPTSLLQRAVDVVKN